MRLLVTRPEPDATRTARSLARARPRRAGRAAAARRKRSRRSSAGPYAAVLMTSANAARALPRTRVAASCTRLPCFTVGDRTRRGGARGRLRAMWNRPTARSPISCDLVAARFAGQPPRLLYLAGEDRAGDLAGDLATRGIAVETAVIYRAVAAGTLPAELVQALSAEQLDGALHYSRAQRRDAAALAGPAGALNARAQPRPLLSVGRGGGAAARGGRAGGSRSRRGRTRRSRCSA